MWAAVHWWCFRDKGFNRALDPMGAAQNVAFSYPHTNDAEFWYRFRVDLRTLFD